MALSLACLEHRRRSAIEFTGQNKSPTHLHAWGFLPLCGNVRGDAHRCVTAGIAGYADGKNAVATALPIYFILRNFWIAAS